MNLPHSRKTSVNKSINKHALPGIDISWAHFDPKIGRKNDFPIPVNSVSKSFTLYKTKNFVLCAKTFSLQRAAGGYIICKYWPPLFLKKKFFFVTPFFGDIA